MAFLFVALQGHRRGPRPELELLYAGAMFHDVGLTQPGRTSTLRFEVNGADAARDFLVRRGVDKADTEKVWLSIALHTTPGIPEFLEPEIAVFTAGVEPDVLGICREDLPPEALAVTAADPRTDLGSLQRRHDASPAHHLRHRQCGRAFSSTSASP